MLTVVLGVFSVDSVFFKAGRGSVGLVGYAFGNVAGALGAASLLEAAVCFFTASVLCYSLGVVVFVGATSGFFGAVDGFSILVSFFGTSVAGCFATTGLTFPSSFVWMILWP